MERAKTRPDRVRPDARPLHIAVVTETFPPEVNGVAMTLSRMVNGLLERRHRLQLVRPRQSAEDHARQSAQFREFLCRGLAVPHYPQLKFGLPCTSGLVRQWAASRPDIVQIATEGPLGWAALRAARRLDLPVVTNFHTNFDQYSDYYGVRWLNRAIQRYLRYFHNRTQLTMVPSRHLKDRLDRLGYKNLAVVARGVDAGLFHPRRRDDELRRGWGVRGDDKVVMVVGRLAAEKNLELACQAFAAMKRVRPNWKLVFVGDGPERRRLASSYSDALFAGTQSGEALARHYASGDVFLFPSLTETYGNVTMEAMASGLAVVAFDYAAAREHITHGVNGVRVPFGDRARFIASARELAEHADRVDRLRARARAVAARLSWDHVCDELERNLIHVLLDWENRHDALSTDA